MVVEAPADDRPRRVPGCRATCAGDVASVSVPPRANEQSIDSSVHVRSMSSIAATIWRWSAITPSRPRRLAVTARAPANSAEAQPPLRPDAPKPHVSASRIRTRNDGSATASAYAVHNPVNPPPTIATSQVVSPVSGCAESSGSSIWSSHRLRLR